MSKSQMSKQADEVWFVEECPSPTAGKGFTAVCGPFTKEAAQRQMDEQKRIRPHANVWIWQRPTDTRATPAPAGEAGNDYATFQSGWDAGFQEAQESDDYPWQNRCEVRYRELFPTAHPSSTTDALPESVVYNTAQRDPAYRRWLIEQLTALGDNQERGPLRSIVPPTTDARELLRLRDEVAGYFAWRLGPDSKGKHHDVPDEAVKAVSRLCAAIDASALSTPEPERCIHCDLTFKPSGPDGWCSCTCHSKELNDFTPAEVEEKR